YYLKGLQAQIEDDNVAGFVQVIRTFSTNSFSLYLYRADGITYREIRNFIEEGLKQSKKTMLYANAKAGAGASLYYISDNIQFSGDVKIDVSQEEDSIKLTFTGNFLEDNT